MLRPPYVSTNYGMNHKLLCTSIQFLFQKSILYAKITVSQNFFFQNSSLNIIWPFYFHSYNNVTNTH